MIYAFVVGFLVLAVGTTLYCEPPSKRLREQVRRRARA